MINELLNKMELYSWSCTTVLIVYGSKDREYTLEFRDVFGGTISLVLDTYNHKKELEYIRDNHKDGRFIIL